MPYQVRFKKSGKWGRFSNAGEKIDTARHYVSYEWRKAKKRPEKAQIWDASKKNLLWEFYADKSLGSVVATSVKTRKDYLLYTNGSISKAINWNARRKTTNKSRTATKKTTPVTKKTVPVRRRVPNPPKTVETAPVTKTETEVQPKPKKRLRDRLKGGLSNAVETGIITIGNAF